MSETTLPPITLFGNDNFKRPRQQYANKLATLSDADFLREAEQMVYLSANANNNPRSDYHWQADACYTESTERRNNASLYQRAFDAASGQQ